MANESLQEVTVGEAENWHRSYTSEPPQNDTSADFLADALPASLEETIAVVKDKVWKFSDGNLYSSNPIVPSAISAEDLISGDLHSYDHQVHSQPGRAWRRCLSASVLAPPSLGTLLGQEGSEVVGDRDEGEVALDRVTREESLTRGSSSRRMSDTTHHRRSGEEGSLLNQEDDDEDDNHGFAESIRRDTDERKSLTRLGSWEDVGADSDAEEDKKDK